MDAVRDFNDTELLDSLDWNRSVVVRKLDGLTFENATALVTPTGLTLPGVVRHLAWCERGWFGHFLLGEPGSADDSDTSFNVDSVDSVEAVVADYLAAIERSREIVRQQASLDVRSVVPHEYFGLVTLRWIILHMTKETARHAGHLDILRELTDGRTGY